MASKYHNPKFYFGAGTLLQSITFIITLALTCISLTSHAQAQVDPDIDIVFFGEQVANGGTTRNFTALVNDPEALSLNVWNRVDDSQDLEVTNITISSPVNVTSTSVDDTSLTVSDGDGRAANGGFKSTLIRFTPVALGSFSFVVTIASNDPDEDPYIFTASGTAISGTPEINVEYPASTGLIDGVSSIGLGTVDVAAIQTGGDPEELPEFDVVIRNVGDGDLDVSGISTSVLSNVANISMSPSSFTVGPGGTQVATISYQTLADGAFSFDLDINNNDADENPFDLRVNGTATGTPDRPQITVAAGGSNIANGAIDDQGSIDSSVQSTVSYTITNSGSAALEISGISTNSATNVGTPSVTLSSGSFPATIPAGDSATLEIRYQPTAAGAFSFKVEIANDDSDDNPFALTLQGTAVEPDLPAISVSNGSTSISNGATDDQGTVDFTATSTASYTITNSGDADLEITGISTNTTNNVGAPAIAVSATGPPYTVPAGDSINVDIQFQPTTASAFSFNVAIASDDPINSTFNFTISGNGIPPATDDTERMIGDFMSNRASAILAYQPNIGDRKLRLTGASSGRQTPLAFDATQDQLNFDFVTSDAASDGLEFWMQGHFAKLDSAGSDADFGVFYAGLDKPVNPSTLIGFMLQLDYFDESFTSGGNVDGTGWMIGPYAVFRLRDNLFFDIRAAWGRSENDISPTGVYTDSFKTERWMISGALSGDVHLANNWLITPTLSFAHFIEDQASYTDSLTAIVPAQTVKQSQVRFGPKVSFTQITSGGGLVTPWLAIEGVYSITDVDGSNTSYASQIEGGSATLKAGADVVMANGGTLNFSAQVDGISRSASSYGVTFEYSIPLN
ncbi:MAG: choice-of-anchor D domain-containing protein [Pseudomonadota bacterium]